VEFLDEFARSLAGLPNWAALLAIVFATFVSEDLTCIGAGVFAARGDLPAWQAIGAAGFGIWIGDLGLYGLGHAFGRPALRRAPLKWLAHEEDVEKSARWFANRGARVILATRFVPGSRLPTYVAAGAMRTGFLAFALYTAIAVALWSPLLGGAAFWLGREALRWAEIYQRWALPIVAGAVAGLYLSFKFVVPAFTWRGRRMIVSRWRRLRHWEFWPPWVFYPPVILYVLWLALRHRSLSLFTAVNPGIYAGGFVGESKAEILRGLAGNGDLVVRARKLAASAPPEERVAEALEFMRTESLDFPVILKPDAGQRGSGVKIARGEGDLASWIGAMRADALVQEFAHGDEYGVFYFRRPSESRGRIFSITRKAFLEIEGDGRSTLERLILDHPRAVCMAKVYLGHNAERLWHVPAPGERVRLSEIGNHCRGALFFDGREIATPELEEAIDRISRAFPGFFFGRYDLRARSIEDLRCGRGFKVIELNGATSEATHIYDPRYGLFYAYRVLFEQWRILFEIARENRSRGAPLVGWTELLERLAEYRRMARSHPA
jgi:membrane protein DedA with SNARE-associated domain